MSYITDSTHEIATEVAAARHRAHDKHGDNSIEAILSSDPRWLSILVEEVGEASHELTYDATGSLRGELIDVITVATAWVAAIDRTKTPQLTASVFETVHDEHTRFPFFETEDATIIGGGHHDREAFAREVTDYDRRTAGSEFVTAAHEVEWRYAIPSYEDGEWCFDWSRNGRLVAPTEPGAIAITLVTR